MENSVTKREKISYGLYFMGQNVFYGLVGYMTTYFTDIGITAALVAGDSRGCLGFIPPLRGGFLLYIYTSFTSVDPIRLPQPPG